MAASRRLVVLSATHTHHYLAQWHGWGHRGGSAAVLIPVHPAHGLIRPQATSVVHPGRACGQRSGVAAAAAYCCPLRLVSQSYGLAPTSAGVNWVPCNAEQPTLDSNRTLDRPIDSGRGQLCRRGWRRALDRNAGQTTQGWSWSWRWSWRWCSSMDEACGSCEAARCEVAMQLMNDAMAT